MPDLEVVGHICYGKINHYSAQGQLKKTIKLSLREDAVDFTPLLYTQAIIPNLLTIYKIPEERSYGIFLCSFSKRSCMTSFYLIVLKYLKI